MLGSELMPGTFALPITMPHQAQPISIHLCKAICLHDQLAVVFRQIRRHLAVSVQAGQVTRVPAGVCKAKPHVHHAPIAYNGGAHNTGCKISAACTTRQDESTRQCNGSIGSMHCASLDVGAKAKLPARLLRNQHVVTCIAKRYEKHTQP